LHYDKLNQFILVVSIVFAACESPVTPGPSDIFYYTTATEYHPDTVNYRDVMIYSIVTNLRTDTLEIRYCPYSQVLQTFKDGEWMDYFPPPWECSTISSNILPSQSVELWYPLYPDIKYPMGMYRLAFYYGSSSYGRGGLIYSNNFYIKR